MDKGKNISPIIILHKDSHCHDWSLTDMHTLLYDVYCSVIRFFHLTCGRQSTTH